MSPLQKGTATYFVVLDDGSTMRVYPTESGDSQDLGSDVEGMIVARFGQPLMHGVGFATNARIVARLWVLPLIVPLVALVAAAVVDRRRGDRRSLRPVAAAAAVVVGVVLGVALSFPDPGRATVRFVAGYLALAALALWAGTRGAATTIVLVAGTLLFGLGSGTLVGRAYAAATTALGIALLVEGVAIHATAPERFVLRVGHVSVVAGAALVAGSIWVRGTLGGDGPIAISVALAVIAAVLWSWRMERARARPG